MNLKINKSKLNLIIDIIMFLNLMGVAGVGFMIKYVLVPGFKRNEIYGRDVELYFFGLDRHQWGEIHLILSFILLFLLLLHIILHWKMIVAIFKRMVCIPSVRTCLTASFVILSLLFGLGPLLLKPEVSQLAVSKARPQKTVNTSITVFPSPEKSTDLSENKIDPSTAIKSPEGEKLNRSGQRMAGRQEELNEIDIFGSMTLREVAEKYEVSITDLAICIHVPKECANERLGRLKRQYGFSMNDLRKYIAVRNK